MSTSDDEAPITTLGEQLVAHKRDASERLRGLVQAALEHTVQRVQEARSGMERVLALGYGLEEPARLDAVERERPRRFEYVEQATDPLAGL